MEGRIVQFKLLLLLLCFSRIPVMEVRLRALCSFLLLLLANLPFSLPSTTNTLSSMGNETDRFALLDFKGHITSDPLGTLSSWNDSFHFCDWEGITCGRRHQRVTTLDLESQGLVGSISPFIGNLTFLRAIRLQNNNFYGVIPQEVGGLFRLRNVLLSNNSLGGEIPVNLSRCSNLQSLLLGYNQLIGKIPEELGSLSKLFQLGLFVNSLTGGIPPSLGNLSSLHRLSLVKNSLDGHIPEELGRLKSLTFLGLGANRLSGKIPPSLYNLSSMETLSLAQNQLQGSLPPDMGTNLHNLKRVGFALNQLSGHIPASLSNASGLDVFEIAHNRFVGGVPSNLGNLQSLRRINLGTNNLGSGKANDLNFLTSLVNCSSLRLLALNNNKFGGELPSSIANLHLIRLYLGGNNIAGSIPIGIGNLVNLILLAMENNQLIGSIPSSFGRLQELYKLDLSGNGLTGRIPSSLGNITRLYHLDLNQNHLSGSIPSSLGNYKYLQTMDLSQNNLDGSIPEQVIGLSSLSIYLDLSSNSLTGFLSPQVGQLKNLELLKISDNKLSGKIPSTLGDCLSLERLYMGGNFFEGNIPLSLGSLKAIQVLDISRNNLSGQIPKALGDLSILQQLNLSFNYLEGEIPTAGIFKNVSGISVTGNNKLCGGIPKLELPTCSNQETRKNSGNSINFKVIVPTITCVLLCLALVTSFYMLYWKRKSKKRSSSASSLEDGFLRVSYKELLKATDGFASTNLIGMGSFGSVYKGILRQNDKPVAVKVLNLQQPGASKSFMAECKALRKIRHRNLLKIITSCSSLDFKGNDFKALVFEFMPNGSLEDWLHSSIDGQSRSKDLNLTQRLNIAIDVASALDYLHNHCQTPIVHCDLKPSNVLLNEDMSANVGDFGLAKFLLKVTSNSGKDQSSSIAVKGSIGYVAPEYGMGSEVSAQGDIYSYGILLLEMVTGKRPINDMFKDGLSLHSFCKIALPEHVMEIVDSCLLVEDLDRATNNAGRQREIRGKMQECLVSLISIGVSCSAISPGDRMDMKNVVKELHVIKEVLLS